MGHKFYIVGFAEPRAGYTGCLEYFALVLTLRLTLSSSTFTVQSDSAGLSVACHQSVSDVITKRFVDGHGHSKGW